MSDLTTRIIGPLTNMFKFESGKMTNPKYIRPIDLMNEAQSKNVPGFKRIETRCCYHCEWSKATPRGWHCEKHEIHFGKYDDQNTVSLQAEFVCDDWEAVRNADDE